MIPGSASPLLLTSVDSGYEIERSLRFNSGDSSFLNRTPSAAGNRRTWTYSTWLKRTTFGTEGGIFSTYAGAHPNTSLFWESEGLKFHDYTGSYNIRLGTAAVFRDPSAWYHIVLAYNSTESTVSDRAKLWVNGVLQILSGTTVPSNFETDWNSATAHNIGRFAAYFDGYMADVHFIDGQALAPTDFGETNTDNLWVPKAFAADPEQVQSSPTTYVSSSSVTDPTNAFDGSSGTEATYSGVNSWISFTVDDASRLAVPFEIRNDSSATAQTVAMFTDSSGSSAAGGSWTSTSNNNLSPAVSTTVLDTYTFPSTGTYYLRHTAGSSNNIFAYKIGGPVTTGGIGTNGFHLDFADNSSNAALGYDAAGSNNWTVNNLTAASNNWPNYAYAGGATYSSTETGKNFYTGSGADLFDGTTSNYVGGENVVGGTVYFRPAAAITGVTSIQLYGAYNGETRINGSVVTVSPAWSTSDQYVTIQSPPSSITEISVKGDTGAGSAARIKAIKVNGSMLVDLGPTHVDSLLDTPTNGATASDTGLGGQITGNYATFNPLTSALDSSGVTISNGNLDISRSGGSNRFFDTTMSFSSGKWYWEMTAGSSVSNYPRIGIWNRSSSENRSNYPGQSAGSYGANRGWGAVGMAYGASGDISSGLPSFTANDILMFAMDLDNGKLWFGKNGTWYSTGSSTVTAANIANNTATARFTDLLTESTGTAWTPIVHMNSGDSWVFNAGQRAFAYTAPTNFKALNTANLPTPTIADGSLYFDTKLWTGNGGTQSISGMNMSPDLIWAKGRNTSSAHVLVDSVRGVQKSIFSDQTTAELDRNSVTAFNSDGFTLGDYVNSNGNTNSYVGWAWDAGSSNTTIAAGTAVTNQAQTWSSNITTTGNSGNWYPSYPATNIFDTTTTNYGHANGDGSVSAVVTLSFSPAITCGSSVSFYGGLTGSGTGTISINGGTAFNLTTGSSATTKTTVAFSGSISSIVVTKTATGGQGLLIYGFEVDGTRLVDGTAFNSVAVPSIASTVRANPSAGFSIVSYTGTGATGTIGHNLNSKPELIIVKNRTNSSDWYVFGDAIDSTYDERLTLNSTVAKDSSTSAMNATAPTSSVFTVGGNAGTNGSGTNIIAYCFAPVEGYSAMGSYTGNGSSTDGPFVYTGHSVAWVMIKRSDAVDNWVIYDVARDTYNIGGRRLYPDLSGGETQNVSHYIDILSNGFKVHSTGGMLNASGGTYIYIAFASNPFASNGGLAR